MPGEKIQIGPFSGGLNTYSDPTSVEDNQLVVCENMELDLDGSLKSRPPVEDLSVPFPLGASGNMQLLGYFYGAGNVPYLLASDGLSTTYYLSGNAWVVVTNTIAASAMAQFNSKAWLLAPEGSANPGGSWEPVGGFTADANMPRGEVIVAFKYRLWVAIGKDATSNSTRLYFSNILGVTPFWPTTPEFIDIGAGDGQAIVQLAIYYQSLLIFRTNSIYGFSYTTDPASGVTAVVVPGIGLESKDSLAAFEGYLYFMYQGRAYEFINNRASQINTPVPFEATSETGIYLPFWVSVFNQRIVFGYYNTMFVFNLRNRTWTTWISTVYGALGKMIQKPGGDSAEVSVILHTSVAVPTGGARTAKTLRMTDSPGSAAEQMICTVQTKNYDYQVPSQYKRIFWWGISAVFKGTLTGTATPIVLGYQVTWADLLSNTWTDELDFTWDRPMDKSLKAVDVQNTSDVSSNRKFVRLSSNGMRFRQINYKAEFTTDGSVATAPVRLFSITTYVSAKEVVSKTLT